ncbi:unnamed protein product [Rotaria magnacalcarata]|uniref:NAD(P)(+)--arginine ADP-ribosyltransferase n=1 Tax=Rotaria magnacalcarata TaxID=392030 RepID=A0A816AR04_9BILA|nr:unnamed protein product [Rotaria magnacalcarata]
MLKHIQLIVYRIVDIGEFIKNEFRDCVVLSFTDQKLCLEYVNSVHKADTIFLVLSFLDAKEILNIIHKLRQVDSVFIYSSEQQYKQYEDLLDKYSKIIDTFHQYTDLVHSIQENIDLSFQQLQSFRFYEQNQKSTRDLCKEAGSFLWLRIFKDVVLNLPHDEKAKKEMIETLRVCYRNNRCQLRLIERFNREYQSEHAILWYTGQPFLYKQLNRALRTEDINFLYTFRYFIYDLTKQLEQEYQKQREDCDFIIKLYRGVRLSIKEVNKLETSVSKLLSTNGYVSTSLSKQVALDFLGSSNDNKEEENVLFEIEYDFGKIKSIIVASTAHLSKHRNEEEFLFDLDAVFHLQSITRDLSSNVILVKMTAVDEGTKITNEYIEEHRRFMSRGSVVILFGYLLADIGQYEKAQHYFDCLLENPNGEDVSFIHYHLGVIKYYQGDYEAALNYYQKSYDRLIEDIPSRKGALSFVLNDIGSTFKARGQYDIALDFFLYALKISETYSNYYIIANIFGNMGNIYRIKGDYDRALSCQMKCLHIREKYQPSFHKDIAKALNNIAVIYNDKDDLDNALEYHQRSLKMNEQCLPAEHENIASSLIHVGNVLSNQGKFNDALDHYIRALQIRQIIFPNGHPTIAANFSSIGQTYYLKKDYDHALKYLEMSLHLRETFLLGVEDTNLVDVFKYIGLSLIKKNRHYDALSYCQRALKISKSIYPVGHAIIMDCLTNIGIAYSGIDDYSEALKYFEKALENEAQKTTKSNLIQRARNYDNMGMCWCRQGDEKTGLKYRMEAVRIISQVYPRSQYADWIDTIGNAFIDKKLFDEALECYLTSLNMKADCLPADHIDVAESFMLIGDVYLEKNKIEDSEQYDTKALCYYEKALAIYRHSDHPNIAYILNSIGSIYENLNEYRLALVYYKDGSIMYQKHYPSEGTIRQLNENNISRIQQVMN